MAARDLHHIRHLLEFLDRMNTNMYEVEITTDFPDGANRDLGLVLQTKSRISVRNLENLNRLFTEIHEHHVSPQVTYICFTNIVLSGNIDLVKKSVDIIFHTFENIENILHQLVDIPIPTYELNLKLLQRGMRDRLLMQS